MKPIYILLLLILQYGIIGSSNNCNAQEIAPEDDYAITIEDERTGKNIKYVYTKESPLTEDQKKGFEGLIYFPVDEKYRVKAVLIKDTDPITIVMKTSTKRAPEYVKYGKVEFQIDSVKAELDVFQSVKLLEQPDQEKHLFIPFRDETTSLETFGGGRYIDSEIPASGDSLILDFNRAYNPYCAYNHKYSCVVPPDENQLVIRIEAGEKIFEE